MLEYLLYTRTADKKTDDRSFPEGMRFYEQPVNIGALLKGDVTLGDIAWRIISLNRYKIYKVEDKSGTPVHRSVVIGRCVKFRFLPENTVEIGPCITYEKFRGGGVYPAVLDRICKLYGCDVFMVVREDNTSSVKGIEKAGFELIGKVIRNKYGIWRSL